MIDMHLVLDESDPRVAGCALRFESGACKLATWRGPVGDVHGTAKRIATQVLDSLLRDGLIADADGTRWPSVVAGVGALIRDWQVGVWGSGGTPGGGPAVGEALTPLPPAVH